MKGIRSFIWKFLGRCGHCGSFDHEPWDDFKLLGTFGYRHRGILCHRCNFITLK